MTWLLLLVLAMAAVVVVPLAIPRVRATLLGGFKALAWVIGFCLLMLPLGFFTVSSAPVSSPVGGGTQDRQAAGRASLGLPLPHAPAGVVQARPDWIDGAAELHGQTYRVPVQSGLWTTEAECEQALSAAIAKAVDDYTTTYFADSRAADWIHLDAERLRQQLVRQPVYAEVVQASVGPMRQLHALVEVDEPLRGELQRLWRQASVAHRLRWAAAGFGLVLAALGALYAYLQRDLRRGGAAGGRLPQAATLTIICIAAGAASAARFL